MSMTSSFGLLLRVDFVGLLVGDEPANSHSSIRSSADIRAHFSFFKSFKDIGSIDWKNILHGLKSYQLYVRINTPDNESLLKL